MSEAQKGCEVTAAGRKFRKRDLVRLIVIAALLIGGAVWVSSPTVRHYISHVQEVKQLLESLGNKAIPVFLIGATVLISFGFPRLAILPLAGFLFGFIWGLVWTQLATLIGYYALFLIVRWAGRSVVEQRWPQVKKLHYAIEGRAVPAIIVLRQLPISGFLINVVLALSPIRHRDFLVGSFLGTLPEAIPLTFVGSSLADVSRTRSAIWVAGGTIVVLILWGLFSLLIRRTRTFGSLERQFEAIEEVDSNN